MLFKEILKLKKILVGKPEFLVVGLIDSKWH